MVDPVDKACFYHCQHGNVISGCCSKGYTYNEQKDVCELITRTWMTQGNFKPHLLEDHFTNSKHADAVIQNHAK